MFEWCNKPILEYKCKHSGDNWGFLVVYDQENDYVLALEMFDKMLEPNTIHELYLNILENKNVDVVVEGFLPHNGII